MQPVVFYAGKAAQDNTMAELHNPTASRRIQSSPLVRYRNITVSVAVFLVFVSGVMIAGNRISRQVQINQVQVDAVGTLGNLSHNILAATNSLEILTLKRHGELMRGHAEELDAQIREEQKRLEVLYRRFQQVSDTLETGGQYSSREGHDNTLVALKGDVPRRGLQNIEALWRDYRPLLEQVARPEAREKAGSAAGRDAAVSEAVREAAAFGRENHGVLYGEFDRIIVSLNDRINRKSVLLQRIQVAAVVLSLLFFLIFIGFFMRRLGKSDKAIAEARNETREILQTVGSGLFLLDKEMNIGSQYSAELERLLGKKDLGGKNLAEVLSDMVANPRDLDTAGSFVKQLYNPRTKERLTACLNPLVRYPVNTADAGGGKELRYLDFKFNRVYCGGQIARVLVNVNDVTEAVQLEDRIEEERGQNDLRMEMLNTILTTDPQLLADFVEQTKKRNEAIGAVLKEHIVEQHVLAGKVRRIFREVHSLKGDASSLKLDGFVLLADVLENALKELQRKMSLTEEDFLPLIVTLEELFSLTKMIEDLNKRIAGGGSARVMLNPEPIKTKLTNFVAEIAGRNGKQVDFTCIGMDSLPLNVNLKSHLNELAVQMVRNAVVHGIETPQERLDKHKLAAGHLRLSLEEHDDTLRLLVEDDGAGIDYEKIRRKLVEEGACTHEQAAALDSKDLVKQIFTPGFSTAEQNFEDAGRGVGMDIIIDRVRQMEGTVSVSTKPGAYTCIVLTVPKKL